MQDDAAWLQKEATYPLSVYTEEQLLNEIQQKEQKYFVLEMGESLRQTLVALPAHSLSVWL